jgi:hypothetical protein
VAAQSPATALQLDGASRLNRVSIARHWQPAQVTSDARLDALRAELKAAGASLDGRPGAAACLIGYASNTALGAADLEIRTVVVGLTPDDVAAEPRINVLRELGNGRTLILTPRSQAYTDLLVGLARRGREIAGNDRILITVLAPNGAAASSPPARARSSRSPSSLGRAIAASASTFRWRSTPPRSRGRGHGRHRRARLRLLSARSSRHAPVPGDGGSVRVTGVPGVSPEDHRARSLTGRTGGGGAWKANGSPIAGAGRTEEGSMPFPTLLGNDAVHVSRIDDASVAADGDRPIAHRNALLVGVRDGSGALRHRSSGEDRYFLVARGRVDWLAAGELTAVAGAPPFGEALLVELRRLPNAPGVARTFGDKLLFQDATVCAYEEILGFAQVRPMHSHAPRLIIPLTGAHVRQRFPSGEAREDRFPAGGAHWAPQLMVHEIRNIGDAPFWAICVEHA